MRTSKILLVTTLASCGTMLLQADPALDNEMLEAAYNGNIADIRNLAVKGANIKAKDEDGWGVLTHAMQKHTEILPELLSIKGIDINATNKTGATALSAAISNVNLAAVKMLLDHGAAVEEVMVPGPIPAQKTSMLTLAAWVLDNVPNDAERFEDSKQILQLIADKSTKDSIKQVLDDDKYTIYSPETAKILKTTLDKKP